MMRTPHNAEYTKAYNRNSFLKLLRQQPMSRAEISHELGLTRAAASLIADELIRDGYIIEKEAVNALRGRPPKPLTLSPDAVYAIGIYLNRDGYQVGIVNFIDAAISNISLRFDSAIQSDKTALLAETIRQLIKDTGVPLEKIVGIGISCPGPVDDINGRILNAPRFSHWANSDLGHKLHEETGLPTYLEKDAACLAYYNIGKGLAKDSSSFLLYLLDGGVGSSIVSNGRLLQSKNGFTSELGHCSIDYKGRVCDCGNIGCLEAYASISRLLHGSCYKSWKELIDASDKEKEADDLLTQEAEYLANGAITAANIADIDAVLLTGDITYGCEKLAEKMEKAINCRWIRRSDAIIRVGKAAVNPHHEIIAAADIAFEHYLSAYPN